MHPVSPEPGTPSLPGATAHLVADALPILGIALFTFVLFKVLSLFVAPANVILCLLAIGHPAGVLLGALRYEGRPERATRHFFLVACASVLALTLLRVFTPTLVPPWLSGGYPLADIARLLGVCAVAFMPLFVGSGVIEYLVLQRTRARTGSTAKAYGVLLGGTLAGFVLGFALLPWTGALGILALSLATLAAATLPPSDRRSRTLVLAAGVLCAVATSVFPRADASFILAVSPGGRFTARGALDDGAELVRADWDRQAYTQVLATPDKTFGAYDNLVYWDVARRVELNEASKDDLVFRVLPPEARLAIIGVGGGRQLHQALALDRGFSIDGFEINETIVRHYHESPEDNGGAFLAPRVHLYGRDGRRGVAEHDPYDCIYLPEAGTVLGYYRTLAIDLNFLHTEDAYRAYASRLTDRGLLASAFASWADPHNYVTHRVAASFRRMGLSVRAYATSRWAVVLAVRPGEAESMLRRADDLARERGIPPLAEDAAPGVALPTDDAGLNIILALTSRDRLKSAFFASMLAVLTATLAGLVWLARRARAGGQNSPHSTPREPGAAFPLLVATGLGASFLLVENAVILNLARHLWNMADAVILGSAAFLVCAVLGALGARDGSRRSRAMALRVGLLIAGVLLIAIPRPESTLVLAGALVLSVSSGSFFPLLLAARSPSLTPYLYASDGLGALLGTLLVFFLPLLFGIGALSLFAAVVCALVGTGVLLAARVKGPAPG